MDELTDAQLEELTTRLRALEAELAKQLEAGLQGSKPVELDQSSVGRLSRMDAMQQQMMAQATQRNVGARLKQCRAAIDAVAADRYGYCRMCEEPIGYARLAAKPEALLCVSCQR